MITSFSLLCPQTYWANFHFKTYLYLFSLPRRYLPKIATWVKTLSILDFYLKIFSVRYSLGNLLKIDFHKNNTFSTLFFFVVIIYHYFFALTMREANPCYSLELCIQISISFLFSLAFSFSSFLSCI